MKDTDGNEASELPAVIGALLDSLEDKNDDVKEAVFQSLRTIAKQNPMTVIHTCVYFRELHRKISTAHTSSLLRIMAETYREQSVHSDVDLASSVAELAVNELTGSAKEEACELLVALGKTHCPQAMGSLLNRLGPGDNSEFLVPHHTIIRTIGKLATGNVFDMIPFIKVTMNIMLSGLDHVREEQTKQAYCYTLGRFAEAINDYLMNAEADPEVKATKDSFGDVTLRTFDVLTSVWLPSSRDHKLIEEVLTALGPMLLLLPADREGQRAAKLTPVLLNICKRSTTRLAAVRVLAMLLNGMNKENKEALRSYLEHIQQTLSEFVCAVPFEASREALLTHYEVLRCSRALVLLYPEEGLDRVLQMLKSQSTLHRARALMVLKHLINTLPTEDEAVLQRIALSLQECLGDGSSRQMVGAIAALAARPTLPLLPSQQACFVRFMVIHCGTKNGEAETCEEALHLLATTVEGAESWLWPLLLQFLMDPTFAASVIPVTRALSPLTVKIIREQNYTSLKKEFSGAKVLGRCLELLGDANNRSSVIALLRSMAPLFGQQLKDLWDEKLTELLRLLELEHVDDSTTILQSAQMWEEGTVQLLEESSELEGEAWGLELADELVGRMNVSGIPPLLGCVTTNLNHITLLVELARIHGTNNGEFARAVGICAKHHPDVILKLMEESCTMEDSRKLPTKLLGLIKDAKAAATAEAAKAGLLKSYSEISRRAETAKIFPAVEKHVLPWIIRQLYDCKEISTKEAGLIALEQVGAAVHPNRLPDSTGLRLRGPALASLLALLQTSSGHKPLQLYPSILKATAALLRIPPPLSSEERDVLLTTILDKVISACSEITLLLLPEETQQVLEGLSAVCSKAVQDSADALAKLVNVILPWMQSNSYPERKAALLTLRNTLRSYHDSLKYTHPGGELEPGKLLGLILPLCADSELALRPLVIDCISLSLSIGTKHRSNTSDSNWDQELSESKKVIVSEDSHILYDGIKTLAATVSERITGGEVVGFAEGLVDSLSLRGEGGAVAGIALVQHFQIRGAHFPYAAVHLIGKIIAQMRQMDNASCRRETANVVKSLMVHHPQKVVEVLLAQPLPLEHGIEECWKEIGTDEALGLEALELILMRLENGGIFDENTSNDYGGKTDSAALPSLECIAALGHLLQSSNSEILIEKQLAKLLSLLLSFLAGWLYVNAPLSTTITKYGYVPNREACKLNPHREVYSVLINVLTVVDSSEASGLLNETEFGNEAEAEESLVSTMRSVVRCLRNKSDVLSNLAHSLGELAVSALPAQRVVSAAFYAELVGRVDCGAIWLDAIINNLHQAKLDSSPLVRKLATIGLSRVAHLDPELVREYYDNCMSALLDGLEEPANGEGGSEVALESLRGLSMLLPIEAERPLSPHVILALKPFIEKENWEMRLAGITALDAAVRGWQKSSALPNNDVMDHLLGCLPTLTVRLEDNNPAVAKAVRETLYDFANLLEREPLSAVMRRHLAPEQRFNVEDYFFEFIRCLRKELPQRAEELRNAAGRGYSRSENFVTRATSVLILGFFGPPTALDTQRMLQLLRDEENIVKARAARALSRCFTT